MAHSARPLLVLFLSLACSTGCLDNPMNTTNGETGTVGGTSAQRQCDDCTIGDRRCHETEEGDEVHQHCVGELDENEAECPRWQTQQVCEGTQRCSAEDGCSCDTTCEPGEQVCKPGGVFLCVEIDGCPREVNVCRNDACDVPTDPALDCDEDSDSPHCQPCGGGDERPNTGRECVRACPDVNDCYTCGL